MYKQLMKPLIILMKMMLNFWKREIS